MKKVIFDKNKPEELTLINVRVNDVVFETKDGYTPSVTIDVQDTEVQDAIKEWVGINNIGKKNPGEVRFSEADGLLSYRFKLTSKTEIIDRDSKEAKDKLEDGAVITLTATAYAYDNKYGKGVGQKLLAVLVRKAGESVTKKAAQHLADLACQSGSDEDDSNEAISEKVTEVSKQEDINMDEIPF